MSHRTILIIDDAADHRDILSRLLRATGYRVLEAAPGPEALSQAQGELPDLILLGLSLPGQAAWETAQQLHRRESLAQTPILGTTVYTTLLKYSHIQALGCIDYVDKPFDMDELLARISYLLPESPLPAIAA